MAERYFECWKCGSYTVTDGEKPDFMCCAPMPERTSGICGGGFRKELTKAEVNKKEKEWKKNEIKKKHQEKTNLH